MLGRYERLRLAGRCPAALREKLKTEQADFHLVEAADGSAEFIPIDYLAHKVTGLADGTDSWTVDNRHAAQPLKLRIDALYSVEPYDGPGGRVLADFAAPGEFVVGQAADGVTPAFTLTAEPSKFGQAQRPLLGHQHPQDAARRLVAGVESFQPAARSQSVQRAGRLDPWRWPRRTAEPAVDQSAAVLAHAGRALRQDRLPRLALLRAPRAGARRRPVCRLRLALSGRLGRVSLAADSRPRQRG